MTEAAYPSPKEARRIRPVQLKHLPPPLKGGDTDA
jgi:hypothetical protein